MVFAAPFIRPCIRTRTLFGLWPGLGVRVSPFFGSQDQGGERTPPEVRVDTSGEVAPVDGLLEISFSASDDTGLAGALLLVNGSQARSCGCPDVKPVRYSRRPRTVRAIRISTR